MAEMRLTVRHEGRGSDMTCETPQGATITFADPDESAFGASPMQHLLASLGACALMDVGVILRKKRLDFRDLRVECVGARPEEGVHPRPFLGFRLVFRVEGGVPQKAFDDAVRLSVEKYCSVGATLAKGAPVAFEAHVGQ